MVTPRRRLLRDRALRFAGRASVVLVAAIPFLGPHAADGQGVTGRVVEAETRDPIPSVTVRVVDREGEVRGVARSDESGSFTVAVQGAGEGPFRIEASRFGYRPTVTSPFVLEPDSVRQVVLEMEAIPFFGPDTADGPGVTGRVVEAETGDPIPSVTVRVVDREGEVRGVARSDESGSFAVAVQGEGEEPFRVEASRFGYRPTVTSPFVLPPNSVRQVVVEMERDPFGLEPLEVLVDRRDQINLATFEGLYQRRAQFGRTGFDRIFLRGDRELERALSVADFLRSEGPPRARMGECLPVLLYRGVMAPSGMSAVLLDLPMDAVEGIELYRRTENAPPGIRPSTSGSCGVAVIWPRRMGDEPW